MYFNTKNVIGLAGCFLLFHTAFVWGQTPVKTARAVEKAAVEGPWRSLKALPSAAAGVPRIPVARMPAAAVPVVPAEISGWEQKMAAKYPKMYVSYQKKVKGLSHMDALRKAVEARRARWPVTESFIVVPTLEELSLGGSYFYDLQDLLGEFAGPYVSVTPAPFLFPSNKKDLYWGGRVYEKTIRNVLREGILIGDCILFNAYSSPELAVKDANFFREYQNPIVIRFRGYQLLKDDIAVVRGKGFRSRFKITRDIPAEDIEMSIMVKGPEGKPIWCHIYLAEDGQSFVLEPYVMK